MHSANDLKTCFSLLLLTMLGCAPILPPRLDPQHPITDAVPDVWLTDRNYDRMIIEITHVEGAVVSSSAIAELESAALNLCKKPLGVRTVVSSPVPSSIAPSGKVWTINELRTFRNRSIYYQTLGSTAVLHVMLVPGSIDGEFSTVGLFISSDTFCIFYEHLSAVFHAPVFVHEFGHVLGLVDSGTFAKNRNHVERGKSRGAHCTNKDCVMYFSLVSTTTAFDKDCLDDLRH